VVLVVGVVLPMDEIGQMSGMIGFYNFVGYGAHPDRGRHRLAKNTAVSNAVARKDWGY